MTIGTKLSSVKIFREVFATHPPQYQLTRDSLVVSSSKTLTVALVDFRRNFVFINTTWGVEIKDRLQINYLKLITGVRRLAFIKSMHTLRFFVLSFVFVLSGCMTIQRGVHMYSSDAPNPLTFQYRDGGSGVYYSFIIGDALQPDTAIFFYGGTGCPSWKSVMPDYVSGLTVSARVFVLNKRFVNDRSSGMFGCGDNFHLANNPDQWVADYSEFIAEQLDAIVPKPINIVLVGVSEGALTATRVAGLSPAITHLAIIGSGGYSMRKSLITLAQRHAIWFDVESGWEKIVSDPRSIEKTWYGNPYRWWSDIMDIDHLPDFLKLDIPVLVGIGDKDESVPVESARFLESKFKEAGKSNLILKVYSDADHRLSGNGVSYRSEFFSELSRLLQPTHNPSIERTLPGKPGHASHLKR